MKSVINNLERFSLDELKKLRSQIDREIISREDSSWNSRIGVDDICYDYEMLSTLKKLGITNMQQLKNNGTNGIPSSLVEKTLWTIKTYDFDSIEKNYKKK